MKKQVFALFLATCLLSSDIPKVHSSQEDIAEQENSSKQDNHSNESTLTEQKDASIAAQ